VITGEGSFDGQSMHGKVPDGVVRAARLAGVPCVIVCGRASSAPPDGVDVRSLVDAVGEVAALGDARTSLERLAAEVARAMDETAAERARRGA
jgi:glycerate kinase